MHSCSFIQQEPLLVANYIFKKSLPKNAKKLITKKMKSKISVYLVTVHSVQTEGENFILKY